MSYFKSLFSNRTERLDFPIDRVVVKIQITNDNEIFEIFDDKIILHSRNPEI